MSPSSKYLSINLDVSGKVLYVRYLELSILRVGMGLSPGAAARVGAIIGYDSRDD